MILHHFEWAVLNYVKCLTSRNVCLFNPNAVVSYDGKEYKLPRDIMADRWQKRLDPTWPDADKERWLALWSNTRQAANYPVVDMPIILESVDAALQELQWQTSVAPTFLELQSYAEEVANDLQFDQFVYEREAQISAVSSALFGPQLLESPYREYVMALTKVLLQAACPSGLPEILAAAYATKLQYV